MGQIGESPGLQNVISRVTRKPAMELSQTERNTHLPLSASTSPTVEVMQSFISRAWVTKVLLLPANRQREGHLERSEDTDASKERGEQCRGEVRILKDLAERNTRAEHSTQSR